VGEGTDSFGRAPAGLVLSLKCFQRLGYFPRRDEVSEAVVDHVRRCLELAEGTTPDVGRSGRRSRSVRLVRERVSAVLDPQRARAMAAHAIRAAAEVKNNPPDLINVALEMLVKASLKSPGFSTLNETTLRMIRGEVNRAIFERIVGPMPLGDRARLEDLPELAGPAGKSGFHRSMQTAGWATWSAFREQVQYLLWVDSLGDTGVWLEGAAETKFADVAGEAAAADAGVMRDVAPLKHTALLACMVHAARTRARDDLAEMNCKRIASITKQAKTELDDIRARQEEISERLIEHYRDVLVHLDPRSLAAGEAETALGLARETVEQSGGFDAELADIEAVAVHHANNYAPLVARHWRRDRPTMFAFARTVELEATSADRSVLDAVEHALAYSHLTRDYIPGHVEGVVADLLFASEQWQRLSQAADHPGRLARRHFEACVLSYLAEELRTGDIAVRGSQTYANWAAQLLSWDDCEPLLGEFCAEAGLPATAQGFTEAQQRPVHVAGGALAALVRDPRRPPRPAVPGHRQGWNHRVARPERSGVVGHAGQAGHRRQYRPVLAARSATVDDLRPPRRRGYLDRAKYRRPRRPRHDRQLRPPARGGPQGGRASGHPVRDRVVTLHLERRLTGTGPEHRWARWDVLDDAGAVVGLVVEEREWLGYRYGPSTYTVAENAGDVPCGARWRSEGHSTRTAALEALANRPRPHR
jgi:Domain of unknown function (DUF4158)